MMPRESNKEQILQCDIPLPQYHRTLDELLRVNAAEFGNRVAYQEPDKNGNYVPLTWTQLYKDLSSIQRVLIENGLKKGDRVVIISRNRREMLELELAVMSAGCISVPIFVGYSPQKTTELTDFVEPRFVAVSDQNMYDKIKNPDKYAAIIHFDELTSTYGDNLLHFSELLGAGTGGLVNVEISPNDVMLMMYTSGTMGRPKCVQLTHWNVLSQQAALKVLWNLSEKDRMLCYLPWHHSFGGIFEKFNALANGAVLSLEDGYGKDIERLIENWKKVLPTIFFSVPKIYQQLTARARQDKEIEEAVFHDELKFVFTAAAPLPKNVSDLFIERGIDVVEGWGLTETAPCCTLTDPKLERVPGIVGKPIPGVEIKIDSDGEILVKGPNVMVGYYKNPEANQKVFTEDGWFRTGDVGEITPTGIRLISRKDRIFKLSNAEKVYAAELENLMASKCAYLSYAFVTGQGRDYPVALLFPNKTMLERLPDASKVAPGCRMPCSLEDFSKCLPRCLTELNKSIAEKYQRIQKVMLIDHELSIENEELTPSLKLSPGVVAKVFKGYIESLYDPADVVPPTKEEVYIIKLET